jgi:class 3 adenylate cyclase/tetratricopeptide (TPR) repeat protein
LPQVKAPESYTPKHLAEKILSAKAEVEGERKQVTALFADLRSSMELFAERDAEDARRILDPVLHHMIEAVHRFEGTVIHVLGDGIVALLGAPLGHEDHAVRACYAALRMQETVRRYDEEIRRQEGIPIQIRVGLNSGEVVVRSIGSDLRMEYTVVGQTMNVAARLEQMADPGSIFLSADTLALSEGYVEVRPLGPMKIKGLEQPRDVFQLTGATPVRSRLQAHAAKGLSRFVGRDSELDQLHQSLRRAANGQGQVVAVVGEPGVGKSRLYWEFTRSHRMEGWRIVASSSVSYGKATAFLPLVELLRGYFQIDREDGPRRTREKVTGRLLSLDRGLEPFLPALLWLLDASIEEGPWLKVDAPRRRQQALEGIKRMLLRESQVQPLVVMFEDLHWIDAETQVLLDTLVESVPTARVLLLVNYRPEYQHGWGGKTYYRQLQIDPLSQDSADALLQALLGEDPGLKAIRRVLFERTEGNPFFLEETVRTLVETGVLVGAQGAYRLGSANQPFQIPTTAQAILAARIDRLAPQDKRLLQAASVVGKDVPFAQLEAIAELEQDALQRGLARLQAAEFLYEAKLFPDVEFTFKHALTHEVSYAGLLHERRRILHGALVEAIERLYPQRLSEQVDRLAHHAMRGELWAKAVAYLREAGIKAMARSASRDAVAHFENALTALRHLPETRQTLEQAIDLRFDLRNALFVLGEIDGVIEYLTEAERLAQALGDDKRLGWGSVYIGHYLWWMGDSTNARVRALHAQAIANKAADFPLQVSANLYLGFTLHTAGDYGGAADVLRHVAHSLQGDLARERFGQHAFPAVNCRSHLLWALAEVGSFEEGIAQGEEGLRLAEALDHLYSLAVVCWGLGSLYGIKGDYDKAVRLLDRALALCHEGGLHGLTPMMTAAAGYVYALSGRDAGLSMLRQALKEMEAMRFTLFHSFTLVNAGEACVLDRRLEEAAEFAQQALVLTRQRGERGFEAWALRLFAEIAARQEQTDHKKAEANFCAALALATELGMRPLIAHCQLGLGRLMGRRGDRHRSQQALMVAARLYTELSMPTWFEIANAELRGPA